MSGAVPQFYPPSLRGNLTRRTPLRSHPAHCQLSPVGNRVNVVRVQRSPSRCSSPASTRASACVRVCERDTVSVCVCMCVN